jgi:gliding motility-associated-like protein
LSDTATKNIRVNLQPRVNAGPDLVIDEGRSGILRGVINDPGVRITWTPATYLSSDTVVRPTVTPVFNTVYIMYGYGDGNCMASDTVRVTVLKQLRIPNAFSPNGDGINDKWVIPYIEDYPNLRMQVFNRYGQPVFTSSGYAKPWDGNGPGGQPLPAGTYYYIIEPNGGGYDKVSGYVLILR